MQMQIENIYLQRQENIEVHEHSFKTHNTQSSWKYEKTLTENEKR